MKERWAFASLSAGPFDRRRMKTKRQNENGVDGDLAREKMSDKTPWSSIVDFLWLIAPMSSCESDLMQKLVNRNSLRTLSISMALRF